MRPEEDAVSAEKEMKNQKDGESKERKEEHGMFRKKAGDRPMVLRPCSSGERPLERKKALQLRNIGKDVEIYLCMYIA